MHAIRLSPGTELQGLQTERTHEARTRARTRPRRPALAQDCRCASPGFLGERGTPCSPGLPGLTAPSDTDESLDEAKRHRPLPAGPARACACSYLLDAQRRVLRAAACARRFAPRLGRSTACTPRLARAALRAHPTRSHATACERSARTPFARPSCTQSGRTETACACKLSGLLAGAATWQQRLPTCSSVLVGEPSSAGGRSPSTFVVRLVERAPRSPRP